MLRKTNFGKVEGTEGIALEFPTKGGDAVQGDWREAYIVLLHKGKGDKECSK